MEAHDFNFITQEAKVEVETDIETEAEAGRF